MNMKSEDKQLVLQDLCGRLPYEVKCQFEDTIRLIDGEKSPFYNYVLSAHHLELFMRHNNFYIKPYLRPLSSMTEEEYNELEELIRTEDSNLNLSETTARVTVDWLNKKMFDYRGLIPKDLALSTDEFNPYKN